MIKSCDQIKSFYFFSDEGGGGQRIKFEHDFRIPVKAEDSAGMT